MLTGLRLQVKVEKTPDPDSMKRTKYKVLLSEKGVFDLELAMSALSIAENNPSLENIGKLRACFSTPQHVSEFIALHEHTPRGVAMLSAIGMELGFDEFTNAVDVLHKQFLNQNKRMDVPECDRCCRLGQEALLPLASGKGSIDGR